MADLKPCPFCGGAAELDTRQPYTYAKHGQPRHGSAVAVYCTECSVQISVCHEDVPDIAPEAVIEMWNARVAPRVPTNSEREMAMLIRRLCSTTANDKTREQAMEYLLTHHRDISSPLRADTQQEKA